MITAQSNPDISASLKSIDVNRAGHPELVGIRGIGPATADRIIEERARRPFADAADFRRRMHVRDSDWAQMIGDIVVTHPEN